MQDPVIKTEKLKSHQKLDKKDCLSLPRKLHFQLCPVVGQLVYQQDSTKTTEHISTRLGWRIALDPKQTLLTLGAETDKEMDPGFISHFLQHCKMGCNLECSFISQGIMCLVSMSETNSMRILDLVILN